MSKLEEGRVSGKHLTVGVIISLFAILALLLYSLSAYSRLDQAHDASAECWREVASGLDGRYRQAEKLVAEAIDTQRVKIEFGERFRLAIDGFRTTSQPNLQQANALELENLLAGQSGLSTLAWPPELVARIDAYNAALAEVAGIQSSLGGRLLNIFLGLEVPEPFEIRAMPND